MRNRPLPTSEGKVLGGPTKRVRQAWVTQTTDVDDDGQSQSVRPLSPVGDGDDETNT